MTLAIAGVVMVVALAGDAWLGRERPRDRTWYSPRSGGVR